MFFFISLFLCGLNVFNCFDDEDVSSLCLSGPVKMLPAVKVRVC